jgi:hypothetical protein
MRLPHELLVELNDERRAWELLASWDVHPRNARLERHAVYTFRARYAEQWRAGRVLLAGDAAHLMPPFAGQGMCAGVRDAANLAWKLGLVLTDRAPDALLDTYEHERLRSARAAIEFSMELGRVICVPDVAEAAARDEAMAAAVSDELMDAPPLNGLVAGLVHPSSQHAGHVWVQPLVDDRLFEALSPTAVEWFTSIGGRVVQLDRLDALACRWFAEHDATWALQRPDFHLYGTATTGPGASALLDDLRAHLSAAHPSLEGTNS